MANKTIVNGEEDFNPIIGLILTRLQIKFINRSQYISIPL